MVKYSEVRTRPEVNYLCAWIRHAISSSRSLQTVRLVCENQAWSMHVSYDGLIDHLAAKHFATLCFLDLGSAFIGGNALKQLCTVCVQLEDLIVGVGRDTLVSDYRHSLNLFCDASNLSFGAILS